MATQKASESIERFVRQRRGRNYVLLGLLLFMVVLFFAVTIARMKM